MVEDAVSLALKPDAAITHILEQMKSGKALGEDFWEKGALAFGSEEQGWSAPWNSSDARSAVSGASQKYSFAASVKDVAYLGQTPGRKYHWENVLYAIDNLYVMTASNLSGARDVPIHFHCGFASPSFIDRYEAGEKELKVPQNRVEQFVLLGEHGAWALI